MPARTNARYGWHPSAPDHRDRQFHLEERVWRAGNLPPRVDLWPKVPPIWNQGQLGSCTAHGSLRAYLTEASRQGLALPMLSRLFQYFNTRELEGQTATDSGGTVRDAIKALATVGCPPESEWPYDPARFATRPPLAAYADARSHLAIRYQLIDASQGFEPMRTALAQGLSIAFGFSVPVSFEDGSWNPASQVLGLPGPREGFIGGHCVAITGYDFSGARFPEYFICDNSWDLTWGGAWGAQGCTGGRFALDARWFSSGLASDLWVIQQDT